MTERMRLWDDGWVSKCKRLWEPLAPLHTAPARLQEPATQTPQHHVAGSVPRDRPCRPSGVRHCPTMHRSVPAREGNSALTSGLRSVAEVSCPNDQLAPTSKLRHFSPRPPRSLTRLRRRKHHGSRLVPRRRRGRRRSRAAPRCAGAAVGGSAFGRLRGES